MCLQCIASLQEWSVPSPIRDIERPEVVSTNQSAGKKRCTNCSACKWGHKEPSCRSKRHAWKIFSVQIGILKERTYKVREKRGAR